MSPLDLALLAAAGVGAGLAGSIAGLASLFSYPALLAVGLSPIAANVTNTVALVAGGAGSVFGSAPELRGRTRILAPLAVVGALGGAAGAALLLVTPADLFTFLVPWLIGLASVSILLSPRREAPGHGRDSRQGDGRAVLAGVFLVAVYGGYFGAAAGVMLLALLLATSNRTLAESAAEKNVVLGLVNGIAAVAFALMAPVEWTAVVPLAAGFLLGGWLGPFVVRHAPAPLLRVCIGAAGVLLATKLGVDAYT